jgi:release factor glutamine methyltransferase
MPSPLTPNNHHLLTIFDVLKWTAAFFRQHDIQGGRIDAEVLLADVLKLKRIDLYLHYDKTLTGQELRHYQRLIKRRIQREPVAYILGLKEFWSLCFYVSKDVLIPRPETECLVETTLKIARDLNRSGPLRILELGTGSGAIMIALANEMPTHTFMATDLSVHAINVAKRNECALLLDKRINWMVGDWFEPIKGNDVNFDIIISNPPYIRKDIIKKLQPEIFLFEPMFALDGGADGLGCYRKIIPEAAKRLCRRGYLILEIGFDQKESIESIARDCGHFSSISFKKDYSGHDRVAVLSLRACLKTPSKTR